VIEMEPGPTTTVGPIGYYPAIDGLRAIAVLAVFLLHNGIWVTAPNGGYGVELFFVISGFLITGMLLREFDRLDRLRLGRFWSRRLARLYPALVVLVATSATYAAISHRADLPGGHRLDTAPAIARSVIPALTYTTNLRLDQHHFFGGHVHLWSLAVEEQFYLVLPLVLWVVLPRKRAKAILIGGVTTLLVGWHLWRWFLYRYAYVNHAVTGSHWWAPYWVRVIVETDRADTLLAGVLLAAVFWTIEPGPRVGRALSVAAPFGLAYVIWVIRIGPHRIFGQWYWPNLFFGAAAALLIAGVVLRPRSVTARLLSIPPLVWLGKISYSFYLWHFLIIRAFIADHQFGWSAPAVTGLRFAASTGAAAASYLLVEQPVRTWFNARQDAPGRWAPPDPATILRPGAHPAA
jgi:peptidoglycan/LPS O-acetylase OafA/YrhL